MKWNSLFLCLVLSAEAAAQKKEIIPFQWTENHAAMLVPVKIHGYRGKYYMQFDLGSPHTLLYKNKLPGITADTLRNQAILVHKMRFAPKNIPVVDAGGQGPVIGTIGADWISNKVVIIDYPRRRLILTDTIPQQYHTSLYPFYFMAGKVLLPAQIMGKRTILCFDTGSSAFSLITDSATAISLAVQGTTSQDVPVNSWGRTLTAHNLPSADSVQMAGCSMALQQVTWVSNASASQVQQMKQLGIGGLTGNTLFLQCILILDTRKQRFGILKTTEYGTVE